MLSLNIDQDDLHTIVTALDTAQSEYERLALDTRLPPSLREQFERQSDEARELADRLRADEGL